MFFRKKWLGLLASMLTLCAAFNSDSLFAAPIKKWHPGHYLLTWANTGTSGFSKIYGDPNFQGVLVRHTWRELEKGKGVYNFSAVDNELNVLESNGKRLAFYLMDKVFNAKHIPCVPDYMLTDPIYKGGQAVVYNSRGVATGCMPKRWVPAVTDRLIALYGALGARFDKEANFEAYQTSEYTVFKNAQNMGDYTQLAYKEQMKRGMSALARVFPSTQVFAQINWSPDMAELFAHAYNMGIGIGGPDTLPTHYTTAYPYYPAYYGKMPLAIDAQNGNVSKYISSGEVDFDDIFRFATISPTGLRVNYMFWSQSENSVWSFDNKVKPTVAKYKGFINKGCPLSIVCR